jgi:NAD(P)H-flavin reductase
VYAGNVVKAMASAKDGYPYIVRLFEKELAALRADDQVTRDASLEALFSTLDEELMATVQVVNRLTPAIVEVVARAPMAARKFHPGQFYRIQNLETGAPVVADTALAAEGLALTGAWVDREQGLISLITLEMGTSSKLCALWQPGQEIVVMGPTGTPTEIPRDETVLLAGGGLGNAVLFSIGKAMREAGNRVIYFAGYKSGDGVFKVEEIEAASDIIVWAVDPLPGAEPIPTTRPQDKSLVGNIVEAMLAYATGKLGDVPVALSQADRIIAIGPARCARAAFEARAHRHRLHQLDHAMHDEGRVRPVPVPPRRPANGRGELRLLLQQPGPAARRGGFLEPAPATAPELRPGKDVRFMAGPPARRAAAKYVTPIGSTLL